jgi:Ser/Thr protein kinase RdoA (MazF antagonist)
VVEASEQELALAALQQFPVEVRQVTRAAESYNTIYRVEAAEGVFALRVGPTLHLHTAGTAYAEAAWQRDLVADGLAVPDVILTSSGEPVVFVNDADGQPRTCVLFTWIDGGSMQLDPSRARVLGELMARLHAHRSVLRDADVLRADKVLYWLLPDRLADLPKVFSAARDSVQLVIDDLWRAGTPQLIHGDLTAANVIEAAVGPVPIDFQDMVLGLPAQDISITIASFGRRDDREALTDAFRAGYTEARPWPLASEDALRGLILARGLHQLNLSAATATGPLPQDYLDYHAVRAQSWLNS